jgi:cytoskeletal protein CcmA (bactofilin family)
MKIRSTKMAKNDSSSDIAINRIVDGTQIEGDIRCESNIRIDGVFSGNLITNGRLVLGLSGKITGTVQCGNAEIEGEIEGKISVQELLSLKSTAKINGDIFTDKLSIEPGANFTGECKMGAKVKNLNFEEEIVKSKEDRTA